jgi:cytochrome c oxidase assembly factor CtaG
VIVALDRPGPASGFSAWTPQPVAIVLLAALVAGYGFLLRRAGRAAPPRWRVGVFAFGVLLLAWTSCGFPAVYSDALYWVRTVQTLLLWLVVPILLLSGRPVQLARRLPTAGPRIDGVLRARPCQVIANPIVGPALVPVLAFVLFFGPVPAWAVRFTWFDWLLQLVLLGIGALMVLPLAGLAEEASSLAVGLSLAIGSFELVLSALPGVLLRLRTGVATSWFDFRDSYAWTPDALHDQRVAGAILWCVAQLINLPFLVFVYRRWLRADARDAAEVDAVLEAERAARQALPEAGDAVPDDRDAPWWLSDPAMQRRLRRPD